MRHPRDMGMPQVEAFPTMRATERRVSASTHNKDLSVLLFCIGKCWPTAPGTKLQTADVRNAAAKLLAVPHNMWIRISMARSVQPSPTFNNPHQLNPQLPWVGGICGYGRSTTHSESNRQQFSETVDQTSSFRCQAAVGIL